MALILEGGANGINISGWSLCFDRSSVHSANHCPPIAAGHLCFPSFSLSPFLLR